MQVNQKQTPINDLPNGWKYFLEWTRQFLTLLPHIMISLNKKVDALIQDQVDLEKHINELSMEVLNVEETEEYYQKYISFLTELKKIDAEWKEKATLVRDEIDDLRTAAIDLCEDQRIVIGDAQAQYLNATIDSLSAAESDLRELFKKLNEELDNFLVTDSLHTIRKEILSRLSDTKPELFTWLQSAAPTAPCFNPTTDEAPEPDEVPIAGSESPRFNR